MYLQTIDGKDYLLGHLAKANKHGENLAGNALAVFNGPHAYVSEKWYEAPNVVPTWNYVAVHISGNITTTSESELGQIIEMMVKNHEGDFKEFKKNIDDNLFSSLILQIVGIKMEIETIEGKWKLSQNRSLDAQMKIAAKLAKQKDHNANLIAELMNKNISEIKQN